MDPPDAWEKERNLRIQKVQGNLNPFISSYPFTVAASKAK